jgi:hypothetical protein
LEGEFNDYGAKVFGTPEEAALDVKAAMSLSQKRSLKGKP